MQKEIKIDLQELTVSLEHLKDSLETMPLATKIDVAARLKAVRDSVAEIEEHVKNEVKTKLGHRIGELPGEVFRAVLNVFPVTRLNQKVLEVNHPRIFAKCVETKEQEQVTFKVR